MLSHGRDSLIRGDYELAAISFKKALAEYRIQTPDRLDCLISLGTISWNLDQYKESADYFAEALVLSNDQSEQKDFCLGILEIHRFFGDALYSRAKHDISRSNELFDRAFKIAAEIKSQSHELKILRIWSTNYTGRNDRDHLRDLNLRALGMALALNNKIEIARIYINLGSYCSMVKNYSQALSYYGKALSFAQELKGFKDVFLCLNNLSFLYAEMGDDKKAEEYISQALKFLGPNDNAVPYLTQLLNIGKLYSQRALASHFPADISFAQNCFMSVAALSDSTKSTTILHLATIELGGLNVESGNLERADSILASEFEYFRIHSDPPRLASVHYYLGCLCLKRNNIETAISHFHSAANISQSDNALLLAINSQYQLGNCYKRLGYLDKALSAYTAALDLLNRTGSAFADDINRSSFIHGRRNIYEAVINLLYDLSKNYNLEFLKIRAFQTIEQMKARSFVEYLGKRELLNKNGPTLKPTNEEDKLVQMRSDSLKELIRGGLDERRRVELDSEITRIDDLLNALAQDRILTYDNTVQPIEPAAIDTIRSSVLKSGSAIVEYFLTDTRSYLIFVSKTAFKMFELPPAAAIQTSLAPYLAFLKDPGITVEKGEPAARRIYNELFLPIKDDIANVDHLIIIPDGILYNLPFECLLTGETDNGAESLLIDHPTISYAPSASAVTLLFNSAQPEFHKSILAFGNTPENTKPDPMSAYSIMTDFYKRKGFQINPIPYAAKEIKAIVSLFKPDQYDAFINSRATETAIKRLNMSDFRIIHIASHAFSDEDSPLQSAFMLRPDNEEDGFLQVLELLKMRLSADLVVLSACETGRGKNVLNEGVLGLPRVFFYMGARSVVSTLWPVSDKASLEFMKEFYTLLAQGKTKSQSLSLAKDSLRKGKYTHPYYWASYILTGAY